MVRAVEEREPTFFATEEMSRAALAAINARDDGELLRKRADHLFRVLPKPLQSLAQATLFDRSWRWPLLAAAVAGGLLSNFLGPSGVVLVVFNPLTLLLVWNLGVYAIAGWMRLRAPREHRWPRGLLRATYLKWMAYRARFEQERGAIRGVPQIAALHWELQWRALGPLLVARLEHLFHLGAIGFVFGALGGTYLRGLFLAYHAIWQSTFVSSPHTVAAILNVVLGPACLLLDGELLTAESVQPLLAAGGAPAAPWIHKLAVMAAIVVLIPRAALAWMSARRATAAQQEVGLDARDPYVVQTIASTRKGQIERIRQGIAASLRIRTGELAEAVAGFVRSDFFDGVVAPTLASFRQNGGRIKELEETLAQAAETFAPQLATRVDAERQAFQRAVSADIHALMGRELTSLPEPLGDATGASLLGQMLPADVANDFADVIGASVTGAVTAVVAGLSGGLGKTIGVAIVAHLLGTTGPIGMLIGAVGALVVVGGGFVSQRQRVAAFVKDTRLPRLAFALPLRESKIAQARAATYAQVLQQIVDGIEPRVPAITEDVLQQLSIAASR